MGSYNIGPTVKSSSVMGDGATKTEDIKVYKRRFWMLLLFSFLSMLCAMLFNQYASMANVTGCYYDVTQEAVNWTCMMFMVVYIVLVFPVSRLIQKIDLRWTVICGSVANTTACAVQFAALKPDGFAFVMVSMFFASISNVFILGIPPFLAAKWFPSNELSRACAFGVFGNQLGVAVGFIFSPLLISTDCDNPELIESGRLKVAIIQTSVNLVILLLVLLTFENQPHQPPSNAQAQKLKESEEEISHLKTILAMIKNWNFILIFIMYGLMVGTYFAIATLLNDLVLQYFPNKEVEIGWMGTLFIVAGLLGSLIAGYILDRTHRFKETSLVICVLSLVTCVIFCGLLLSRILWVQFVTFGAFGFFLTSFLPIGFEYGIEVIFPLPESTCACMLNTSTMFFGIIITQAVSLILDNIGPVFSNAALCTCMLLSCLVSGFITTEYKRTQKNNDSSNQL